MKRAGLGRAAQGKGLQDRLKIAERRLRRLLEDVERDRDRLEAESLTLRFVWHQEGSPLNRIYLSSLTNYGPRTGHFFGSVVLPLPKGEDSKPSYCLTYLFAGDSKVRECFTRHCREAEAIFCRMAGDGTRFNWAKELFETFWNADDEESANVVEWREVEEPDHPEACSYIVELIDVFECTRKLLEIFQNRAELRQQSPDGRLPDYERNPIPALDVTTPDAEQSDTKNFAFQRDGDGYMVRGFGEQGHVTAKGVKGLHDIFRLVQSPGIPVPMLELSGGAGTKQLDGDSHSRQPVATSETRRDIEAKRRQLKADIESSNTDLERDELRGELENLEAEAIKMYGLHGKARDLNNPNARLRAKLLVRKTRACTHLKNSGLSKLAEHLDSSIVSAGACLMYRPTTPNIDWDTEPKV
jgi:hypothetical protein